MPLYAKAEDWSRQTSLLLKARPTTTRITTKYTIRPAPSEATLASSRAKRAAHLSRLAADAAQPAADSAATAGPRAVLELRTFCPESGVVLKYRTDKAAEVGRLIGQLGRMGRAMGAMEDKGEEVEMVDAPATTTPAVTQQTASQTQAQSQSGGGGKKKKKGKK